MNSAAVNSSRLCLVVVDMQERLMPAIDRADEVVKNAAIMVRCAMELEVRILALTQYSKGLGPYVPELEELLAEVPKHDKTSFSLLGAEGVTEMVAAAGIDTYALVGAESHICIWQSAMALKATGKKVWVLSDAVSSRNPQHHREALAQLRAEGITVLPVEALVYALLGRAGTPEFKKILPYIV